jgi:hypothetical protein
VADDVRCFTLEGTVEFFNLGQGLKLQAQEEADLVFTRQDKSWRAR